MPGATPPPTTGRQTAATETTTTRSTTVNPTTLNRAVTWLFFQDPTGCPSSTTSRTTHDRSLPTHTPEEVKTGPTKSKPWPLPVMNSPVSPPIEHPTTTSGQRGLLDHFRGQVLLRKEVIQPHLPVRLPCYDFVPIADPTFDSSLSCELGHWLRVLPTFVT